MLDLKLKPIQPISTDYKIVDLYERMALVEMQHDMIAFGLDPLEGI